MPSSDRLADYTSRCIRCGFCLEACPTFVETGLETESPRGRIYLSRAADEGEIGWEVAQDALDTCLGCRACETACPSGVQYGRIAEIARDRLAQERPDPRMKLLLGMLTNPGLMRLAVALAGLLPGRRAPSPYGWTRIPEPQPCDRWPSASLPFARKEVLLLEGCVMPVLYPRVREATVRLLARVGFRARGVSGCCGALHGHNGLLSKGREMADRLGVAGPIVTDSAGCGSWLQEALRVEVVDVSVFLAQHGLTEQLQACEPLRARITYHDACHLAHGQGVRAEPRALIEAIPGLALVPLPESDTCCGSAGVYSVTQPDMASRLADRKWRNIEATGADFVVCGNPGCHAWLDAARERHGSTVRVLHTVELLETAFSGFPED